MENKTHVDGQTVTVESTKREEEQNRELAEMSRRIRWLSVADVAKWWMVSQPRIRRWQRRGLLPYHKVGNRILFLAEQLHPLIPKIWKKIGRPLSVATSTSVAGRTAKEIFACSRTPSREV